MSDQILREVQETFIEATTKTAAELSKFSLERKGTFKGRELKSEADIFAEELLISSLQPLDLPLYSEEMGEIEGIQESKYQIIIDPLDGTVNFERGSSTWAISLSLLEHGNPVVGVVYSHLNKSIYSGIVGAGAYRNGMEIFTSSICEKKEAVLATGFPSKFDFSNASISRYVKQFREFAKVRMIGSAATSLCLVADGTYDCYLENNIRSWDVAGGLAICLAAGGFATIEKFKCIPEAVDIFVSNGKMALFKKTD